MNDVCGSIDSAGNPAEFIFTLPRTPAFVAISPPTYHLRTIAMRFETLLHDILETAVVQAGN